MNSGLYANVTLEKMRRDTYEGLVGDFECHVLTHGIRQNPDTVCRLFDTLMGYGYQDLAERVMALPMDLIQ
jgi:hypothetical protein